MDSATLHHILLHTFSNDNAARKSAEEAVNNLHQARGSLVLLVQLTTNNEVQREIRQAAAVSLKNLVQKHWEGVHQPDETYLSIFPDLDKEEYKKYIFEGLLTTQDTSLRSLLAESVNTIARLDFPV